MEAMNRVALYIGGTEYFFNSDEDANYVVKIGHEVDKKISDLLELNSRISTTAAAIFAALDFCDKKFKAEESAQNLRNQIKEYVDDANRARMEADEARKEIGRLNLQIQSMRVKLARLGEPNA
jgi:cell division protein ZapA